MDAEKLNAIIVALTQHGLPQEEHDTNVETVRQFLAYLAAGEKIRELEARLAKVEAATTMENTRSDKIDVSINDDAAGIKFRLLRVEWQLQIIRWFCAVLGAAMIVAAVRLLFARAVLP